MEQLNDCFILFSEFRSHYGICCISFDENWFHQTIGKQLPSNRFFHKQYIVQMRGLTIISLIVALSFAFPLFSEEVIDNALQCPKRESSEFSLLEEEVKSIY